MPRTTPRRQLPERSVVCEGDDLSVECAAFLAGTWAVWRTGQGGAVPCWAWLNEAAHADIALLRASAAAPARATPRDADDVRVLVARALLAAAGDEDLRHVQRCVLVPLELQLMESDASPRRIVELATRALFA